MVYDIAIVGAGPAGSSCAAFCARAGLTTIILERERFPREKVCGDCINPSCWKILSRLDLCERLLALPHSKLEEVEFIGVNGQSIKYALNVLSPGEIAIKRSLLDQLLLQKAVESGAKVKEGTSVIALENCSNPAPIQEKKTQPPNVATPVSIHSNWTLHTDRELINCRILVAADGRNSSIARMAGLSKAVIKDRVATQTHMLAPENFGNRVVLYFLPKGYCGIARIDDQQSNLCLVAKPNDLSDLKKWANQKFDIMPDQIWRTIAPLTRSPLPSASENLLLVGDAARVMEPFTGEGIFYALASGELASKCIIKAMNAGLTASSFQGYQQEHSKLYSGRLWVNQLARQAVLHPNLASLAMRLIPQTFGFLLSKTLGATTLNSFYNRF